MIERKTLSDLNSSIKGQRYREEKQRILDSKIPQKYYIVEGCFYIQKCIPGVSPQKQTQIILNPCFSEQERNRLYGAIVNTTVRDRLPVIRTENLEDTVII